jgi:hypothetical protein
VEWHFRATEQGRSRLVGQSRIDPWPSAFSVERNGHAGKRDRENSMLDIVMLVLGLGFFAVAVGYTYACERL